MKNRRDFLKNAGALTAGGLILPYLTQAERLFSPTTVRPIGIQLFTLFRQMNEDPKGTLEKIAAAGYKEVESAFNTRGGYYGYNAKDFKTLVGDLGMKWRAHHAGGAPRRPRPTPPASTTGAAGTTTPAPPTMPANMPPMLNLRDNYQQLIDEAGEGGLSYLVCSSTPVGTVDEINKSIEVFQKTGEAAKKAGIGFAYHNHSTEFDPVEGAGATVAKTPYELILSQTDKDLVKMELDLAWATKAGKDPVELFKGQPGRFPLWHIKDIKSDLKTITEVGNGVVDFKHIFEAAKIAGLKYIFVEQDMAPGIESIQTSYQNLTKVLA